MKILAIDTSTQYFSLALFNDGDILETFEHAPRQHAKKLLPTAERMLQEAGLQLAGLDAIAFGRGPGAFTGLRIAAAAAQGMGYAAQLPVVPVSSLAATALGAAREFNASQLAVAFDARMGEVYWGCYEYSNGILSAHGREQVCAPSNILVPNFDSALAVADGWPVHQAELTAAFKGKPIQRLDLADAWAPHAADIARLASLELASGKAFPAEMALPVYLRDNVAKRPASMGG
jgi:tRNA threonylcarbamoyladenosine biosynthesis protein TsaB